MWPRCGAAGRRSTWRLRWRAPPRGMPLASALVLYIMCIMRSVGRRWNRAIPAALCQLLDCRGGSAAETVDIRGACCRSAIEWLALLIEIITVDLRKANGLRRHPD